MAMSSRPSPPLSVAEVYRRYAAGRPALRGVILPDLLPHVVCGAAFRRPGRVKVLFVAESPPWSAGRQEVVRPQDCRRPDYPYFWNDRYTTWHHRVMAPLSGGLAENLFRLLGLRGKSRRENLDLFSDAGFFLVDTVKCVFRKNRKPVIPADLIRMSAREVLAPEVAALAPECIVLLGNTALAGFLEIEPYATALAGVGKITGSPPENLFEEHRLLCLPYPGRWNRRYLDRIESGFLAIRDLV